MKTRTLKTPNGMLVEDTDKGLFLVGEYKHLIDRVIGDHAVLIHREDNDNFTVQIGYSDKPDDGWAEWGSAPTLEDAWRYALGAHYGGYDDPEVSS